MTIRFSAGTQLILGAAVGHDALIFPARRRETPRRHRHAVQRVVAGHSPGWLG